MLSRALKVSVTGWAWLATEFCVPVPEPNSPYLWTGRRRALQNWAWRRLELQTAILPARELRPRAAKGPLQGPRELVMGLQWES